MKKFLPENAILVPDKAEKVFSGVIFDVYQWQQELFDGSKTSFEMLRRPDTVSTIGVVDGKLMALHERQPHSGEKYSFTTGRVDPEDQSILAAAKREMVEETGYTFKNWRLVSVKQPPTTKIEWFVHTFIAWDIEKIIEPHLDAGEKNEIKLLPIEEATKLSQQGVKYLSESRYLLESLKSLDDLLLLPEFNGQEVDR